MVINTHSSFYFKHISNWVLWGHRDLLGTGLQHTLKAHTEGMHRDGDMDVCTEGILGCAHGPGEAFFQLPHEQCVLCFWGSRHAHHCSATAKMTPMSSEQRGFGDSNNPQQFWSLLELYKWLSAPRHAIPWKAAPRDVFVTSASQNQRWRTWQSVLPHLETPQRRLWRLSIPLFTCSGWSNRWD